jgi:urease accessory protein
MNTSVRLKRAFTRLAAAAAAIAAHPSAQAHLAHGEAGGFASGFKHPWSGWDHIAAMVGVGLWGAQLGAPAIWLLPVTFPLVMAVGGFMGLVGIPLPGVEVGIGLSALMLGIMVVAEVTPKHLVWPAILVGAFGLFHGHAHGTELPPGESGILYSIGFVVATGSLHACGIALGLVHRWPMGEVAVRIGGAVIAAAGAYFLWVAVHPQ